MAVHPFKIQVSPEKHSWITERVQSAHIIPDLIHPDGKQWTYGIPTDTVTELVEYWRNNYDWRKVEEKINSTFNMFTTTLEEAGEKIELHFVHHRSSHEGAVPLLFAHGWPGNFLEVENLLKPLTSPDDPKHQAFHIVAPSIPGFTFSSSPIKPGFTVARIASIYHKLMLVLGYTHYIGQGGDWGSFILRAMALDHPESCIGVHVNFILALPPSPIKAPLTLLWLVLRWFTPDQKKRLQKMQWWMKEESGYQKIQGTKPQTISYALQDSPVGMLAWIREKLDSLAEPDFVWDKELVITWTILYLLSGSASHARIYKEGMVTVKEEVLDRRIPKEVAFGVSCFPVDVGYIPKWWAEASVAENVVFWREHDKGGHFASVECSDLLVGDILEFTKAIQGERLGALVKAGLGNGAE